MNIDYNSFEWRLKAYQIKKRDKFKCQICPSNKSLEVHHITYINGLNIWDYPSNYLITLCSNCHISEHAAFDLIGKNYTEALLSGMLSIDIYRKIKSKELFISKKNLIDIPENIEL